MATKERPLLDQYDQKTAMFEDFKSASEGLIKDLLIAEGIRVHTVTSRVKERSSLAAKLSRIGKDYRTLAQVTDIVGIRVITHLEGDVDIVGQLLEREFAIDKENSVDKRKALDPDRFGYLSLHYVCSISHEREKLAEYRRFQGLCLEIQVRSILQHAWAEIEHDLGYKTGATIPAPMRRRFSRLAGLLEIADTEFSRLSLELKEYSENVKKAIEVSPAEVGLDDVSLASYVETNPLCTRLDELMARYVKATIVPELVISGLVQELAFAGIKTIDELHNALSEHFNLVQWQWERRMRGETRDVLYRGIGVFHLFQVLMVLQGGEKKLSEAFARFNIGGPAGEEEESNKLIASTILQLQEERPWTR